MRWQSQDFSKGNPCIWTFAISGFILISFVFLHYEALGRRIPLTTLLLYQYAKHMDAEYSHSLGLEADPSAGAESPALATLLCLLSQMELT